MADVFALQTDGTVQALAADGSLAWSANVGTGNTLLPDFLGGLEVASPTAIQRLDGITGQVDAQYTYAGTPQANVLVGTDGTIYAIDGGSLVGINPTTGSANFSIPLEPTTYQQLGCGGTNTSSPATVMKMIVAGDGNAYALYQFTNTTYAGCEDSTLTAEHLRVMMVSPAGSAQEIDISDWTSAFSETFYQGKNVETFDGVTPTVTGTLVTNANTGVSLALHDTFDEFCYPDGTCTPTLYENRLVVISNGSVASDSYLNLGNPQYAFTPVLQRQDGTYFGVGITSPTSMDAFDQYGNVLWSVPGFYPQIATADGGVIAQSNTGQYLTFDQNGVADGMMASLPTYSWTSNWYSDGTLVELSMPPLDPDDGFATFQGGTLSHTGTYDRLQGMTVFVPGEMNSVIPSISLPLDEIWVGQVESKIGQNANLQFRMWYSKMYSGDLSFSNQGSLPDRQSFLNALTVTNTVVVYIGHGMANGGAGPAANVAYGLLFLQGPDVNSVLSSQTIIGYEQSYNLPYIVSLSLSAAMVGSQIVLTGTSFGANQGNSTVTFNPTAGGPPVNLNVVPGPGGWTANQIVVSVPEGTPQGQGTIAVNVNGSPSNQPYVWIADHETPATNDVRQSVPVKAKVLFLAMCGFTQQFIPFWNMPTTGHALVYPSYSPSNTQMQVQLAFAANDAKEFMSDMAAGTTVAIALKDANDSKSRQNEQIEWEYYGDNTTGFLPPQ